MLLIVIALTIILPAYESSSKLEAAPRVIFGYFTATEVAVKSQLIRKTVKWGLPLFGIDTQR